MVHSGEARWPGADGNAVQAVSVLLLAVANDASSGKNGLANGRTHARAGPTAARALASVEGEKVVERPTATTRTSSTALHVHSSRPPAPITLQIHDETQRNGGYRLKWVGEIGAPGR
jgi:hypothetical protein